MSLILLNLQSNQKIKLDNDTPLIIGRGNVNGCFDKRVSRNHGRITCTVDGKIRVAALHSNPCFFTRNGVPPVQQLNKNEEETLSEGDYLGLLPNAFWFKITSNKNTENGNRPVFNDTETDVTSNEASQTILLENSASSSLHKEITINEDHKCVVNDESQINKSKSLPNLEGAKSFGTPEFEKTKRLPLHMYQIDDPLPQRSSKKHSLEDKADSKGKKQKILQESNIKKEFEIKTPEKIKVEDNIRNFDIPSTSRVDEISHLPCKSEKEEKPKDNNEKEGYESVVEVEDEDKNVVPRRPICQYEDKCYRKNSQHKLDFCHPGDPDYIPYEERPLCQYGAACYRQNEKHKSEFRHPPPRSDLSSSPSEGSRASSPLPEKRRRKTINMQNYDYEEDNEYEMEEPFANDASSDDFVPSDLGSEDEEILDTSRED